jgi:uncharacterized protein VirK/YbjX
MPHVILPTDLCRGKSKAVIPAVGLTCNVMSSATDFKMRCVMAAPRNVSEEKWPWKLVSVAKIFMAYVRFCSSKHVKDLNPISRGACAIRAFRALFFLRAHEALFKMEVFSNYAAPRMENDLFHHLSRRFYLATNLGLRQRVKIAVSHYHVEDHFFDSDYKREVYSDRGLLLWKSTVDGTDFQIRLRLADRYAAEGGLCIMLTSDDARLHTIAFSWLAGDMAMESPISIFVGLNQGRPQKEHQFQSKFEIAFPNNSANFACYAALQGLARAVRVDRMIGVSSKHQVCFSLKESRNFDNAYNGFWHSVGGVEKGDYGFILPVPRPRKDLSALPAKHRKRAMTRRIFLDTVEARSFESVSKHLDIGAESTFLSD